MKTKKSIILTFTLAVIILFNSCSSDDDNAENDSIVGTFLSTSFVNNIFRDGVLDELDSFEETSDDDNFTSITFNSDNTISTISFVDGVEDFTSRGTYIINGNILSITTTSSTTQGTPDDDEVETSEATFVLGGDVLRLDSDSSEEIDGELIRLVFSIILIRQ